MSSPSSIGGKSSGRTRPAALTACEACRRLKMRCIRPRTPAEQSTDNGTAEPCERCRRNKRACTIPEARPLGRRRGATGRYHGLEKAYRRMQSELKKAQTQGGAVSIKEALQSLPDVVDVPDIPEIPDIPDIPDITDVPEVPEVPVVHDVPDLPDVPDVPPVPTVPPDSHEPGSIAGVLENDLVSPAAATAAATVSAGPASFPYDEPAQPDPEPMSNPLALLADASSDAAQALECGSVAIMTSPRSCASVASSGEATVNIGRRLLRRPGYVSLGLRLSRDTLEQGLDALFAPTPNTHPHPNYFKPPSWAPLRDVGPDIDPIDLGLVTMEEAKALFPIYFTRLHPINGILDPILHTPDFVRSRSALLFTWILALTAQFDHGSASIAKRLRLHGEKLSNHVHACGFKSVEIIQGYYISLLSANPAATLAEERSWLYTMYAFGLGSELGLDQQSSPLPQAMQMAQTAGQLQRCRPPHARHYLPDASKEDYTSPTGTAGHGDPSYAERLARNRERTWLRILLWERANSAAHGRMHSFPETELTRNVERWWLHPLADSADKHTCAFIILRRTLAALQRELRRQASFAHVHDPHWVRNLVDATLRPWWEAWLPSPAGDPCNRQRDDDNVAEAANAEHAEQSGTPPAEQGSGASSMSLPDTYLLHVYLHGRLWTLSFALHSSISDDCVHLDAIRQDCFEAAVQCCEAAVRDLQTLGEPLYCMLAPTWAMISYAGVLALSLFPTLYGGSSIGSNGNGLTSNNTNTAGAGGGVQSDAELLALVSQVALQLERAGTTPSHRYGIAALLGHHLVSILRTRALGPRDQPVQQQVPSQALQQSQPQPQLQQPQQQQQQLPLPQHSYQHQPYPLPDICASEVDGWPGPVAYHDDIRAATVAAASTAATLREYAPPVVDPIVPVYDPFWTTAMMSTEGDLTGEGFADLFRDMFGPGFGGVF